MFTPEEMEAIPVALEQLFDSLQMEIMLDVIRLLLRAKEITPSVNYKIHRLYDSGKSKSELKDLVQRTLDLTDEELEHIFSAVIESGYNKGESVFNRCGKEFIPYAENEPLQQFVRAVQAQTQGECRNITQSMGFAQRQPDGSLGFTPVADYYQETLDKAVVDIASGAFDYNTVLKRTVKEMTDSGLRTVDYESGWSNRVDVAARRAVMTGFNQVVAHITEENAEKLGTDYFEVTYHMGARPTHQPWQGRVYSKQELETVCGLGTVTGLCGANCYHSYSPFIKGIDTLTYSEEELDRMNEEENTPKEYNGRQYTAYEAQQRQRQLETAMRADRQKIELLTQGGADYDTITGAKVRYFQRQDEYVKFSKAMGLPEQWERITVDGKNALGSKLPKKAESVNKISGEAVHRISDSNTPKNNAEIIRKDVAKTENSGIIKFEKGVTEKIQNAFNTEFEAMQEKFGEITTISSVGVLNSKNSTDYGAFYDNSGELLLRFANKKNALSEHEQKAQKMKKSGEWSSAHPLHTFRHEIGHAIQLEHKLNDPLWDDKLEKIIDIMEEVNPEDVSLYGFTTLDEFISECIAESMTKKARATSKRVARIIRGVD